MRSRGEACQWSPGRKRSLSAEEKLKVCLGLVSGRTTQRDAAERWSVDPTTIMRIRRSRARARSVLWRSRGRVRARRPRMPSWRRRGRRSPGWRRRSRSRRSSSWRRGETALGLVGPVPACVDVDVKRTLLGLLGKALGEGWTLKRACRVLALDERRGATACCTRRSPRSWRCAAARACPPRPRARRSRRRAQADRRGRSRRAVCALLALRHPRRRPLARSRIHTKPSTRSGTRSDASWISSPTSGQSTARSLRSWTPSPTPSSTTARYPDHREPHSRSLTAPAADQRRRWG